MKERTTRSLLRSVALVGAVAAGAMAFGYDDGGRYIAETETFSEPTKIEGDVWIGNDNAGVFTKDISHVWASSDELNAGATLTGWLRIADWGGTAEKPLYGSLDIQSGNYSAEGLTIGGSTPEYTHAWAKLSGGVLTVSTVNIGSTAENAGEAELTLNGGKLVTPSVSGTGTLAVGENGGTFEWDSTEEDATIAVALTGSGTLTKTGAGNLIITGSTEAFKGKIVVEAGTVKLGEDADDTTINAGETKKFYKEVAWANYFDDNTDGWAVKAAIDQDLANLLMVLKGENSVDDVLLNGGNATGKSTGNLGVDGFVRLKTAGRQSNNGSGSSTYTFPEEFSSAKTSDYEFSCAVAFCPGANTGRSSYLAIRGEKGILAVIEFPKGGNSTTSTATLYTLSEGALVFAGQFTINGRGINPETGAYWYDVVISANETTGTVLSLTRQGADTTSTVRLGDYDNLASLYAYQTTDNAGIPVDWGFNNFVLKTEDGAGVPVAPVLTTDADSYRTDWTVTIDCDDEDAKIFWCDDSGVFTEYTEALTFTAPTTIYAYAQNAIGKSETVSMPVYANVKLNAPSVARRGWYRMQITAGANPATGVTPAYTFTYQFPGKGEDEKTTTESGVVQTGHSGDFNKDGVKFWAYASADGYLDSDKAQYTAYTFDSENYTLTYNKQFVGYKYTTVWYSDTVESNGTTYRSIKENNTDNTFHDPVWFSNIGRTTVNDAGEVTSDFPRWTLDSGKGLYLNNLDGTILFKSVKPGSLIYVNSDHEPWNPVNLELDTSYTNPDEYVYTVTGEDETVDATLSFTKNKYIFCIKIYEPIPEVTDTVAVDDVELVDGAFSVPVGTTTITLGDYDVTRGFDIADAEEGAETTTATLYSPWFAWYDGEPGEGMVIDEDTVTLDIELVPGLFYGPAAATTLEGLARPPRLTQFDGTNGAKIKTIVKPEGDSAFFTIYVDVKAE